MENGYAVSAPLLTWRQRLRLWLLPVRYCPLPAAPASYQDCVVVTTYVALSVADRLRVLLTGQLTVQTRTVTEHVVGESVTASVVYAGPPAGQGV
jgi:hypothetical protein